MTKSSDTRRIKICDKDNGSVIASVPVTADCVYYKELMSEEYVQLAFSAAEILPLKRGDYVDIENIGRFEIVTLTPPERDTSTGGWKYEQKFLPVWGRWADRIMFYDRQRGSEKTWKMTQRPEYFMEVFIGNLRAAGFDDGKQWNYAIDASLSEMKLVTFDATSLLDALSLIAEAWETEWWIEGHTVHISKCQYGTPVVLEEGAIIQKMTRDDSKDTSFANRLYAFGSTRNLPKNYRRDEGGEAVIEGVVETRLKLPEGTPYVDASPDLRPEDIVEGVAVFEEVYPHRIGTMTSISVVTYTDEEEQEDGTSVKTEWHAFRYRDNELDFRKEYIIDGEELRIVFQTGRLAGMDFAVTFNPDGKKDETSDEAQVWEIVRNDDYGISLPTDDFKPKDGDTYILYGYNSALVSEQLVPAAEKELLEKATETVKERAADKYVYTCTSNPVRCAGYVKTAGNLGFAHVPGEEVDLNVGQSVVLHHDAFFGVGGSLTSRIRAVEKRLDNVYNCIYTVGDDSGYSKIGALQEQIDEIAYNGGQLTPNAGAGGIYLIKRNDSTAASDFNAFSALRSRAEFLHRVNPDTATGLKKFLDGIEVGAYRPQETGGAFNSNGDLEARTLVVRTLAQIAQAIVGKIGSRKFVDGLFGEGFQIWQDAAEDGDWSMTVDRLTVRKAMALFELLIDKIRAVCGQIVVSAANGKIKTVETVGDNYRITFETDNTFVEGDLMRCQTFNGAGLKSYWVRVSGTEGDSIIVPVSEFGSSKPEVGDECVLMGNTDNPLRQNLISISATEDGQPRVDVLDGVSKKGFTGCLRARLGNLDGISDSWFPPDNQPHGDGLYADNAFLHGTFVLSTGEDVKTRFEILEGRVTSEIQSVEKELLGGGNYFANAYFTDGRMDGWRVAAPNVKLLLAGTRWVWVNGKPLSDKRAYSGLATDGGRVSMHIRAADLLQRNEDMADRPACDETDAEGRRLPAPVRLSFMYRCNSAGHLTAAFENVTTDGFAPFDTLAVDTDLQAGDDYDRFEADGLWNGTGDFRLSFTGDIFIYGLCLSSDAVSDIIRDYTTRFEQTDKLIAAEAEERIRKDNELAENIASLVIKADSITAQVSSVTTALGDGIADTKNLITTVRQTAERVSVIGQIFNADGSIKEEAGLVTTAQLNKLYAIGDGGAIVSIIEQTPSDIRISAKNIQLEGLVTANENFKILEDGSIEAAAGKFTGEITASSGKIGLYDIDENGLYYGDLSKWTTDEYINVASVYPGMLRLQKSYSYSGSPIATIKVGLGEFSDPQSENTDFGKCERAAYFYRSMMAGGNVYSPAVKIVSDNIENRNVALYTKGASVCNGGLLPMAYFMDADKVSVIDFSFGSTVLIKNTVYRKVYLPLLSDMKLLLGVDGAFAVPVTVVARYDCTANVIVSFRDGDSRLYFLDYNGNR